MDNTSNDSMIGLQGLFNWIAKLAYINVLWILFSLMGLVVCGVGPATISVFTVIRRMLRDGDGFSIWRLFLQTYREEFWSANKLMLVIVPVFIFIYFDFIIIQSLPYSVIIDYFVFPALIVFTLLVVIITSYLLSVSVHYKLTLRVNIKHACLIAGLYPLTAVLIISGLFIFTIIVFIVPAIIPLYMISVPALIIQACTMRSFRKLSARQALIENSIVK